VQDRWRPLTQEQDRKKRDGAIAEKWGEAGWKGGSPPVGHDARHQEGLQGSGLNGRGECEPAAENHIAEQSWNAHRVPNVGLTPGTSPQVDRAS